MGAPLFRTGPVLLLRMADELKGDFSPSTYTELYMVITISSYNLYTPRRIAFKCSSHGGKPCNTRHPQQYQQSLLQY